MSAQELEAIARKLIAPARGILAADESTGTIERRFKSINVPNTEASRQAYRDMLFTTPGFGEYISGVILFDETIRQKSLKGVPFTEVLTRSNSIPGIKVDAGAKPLPFAPDEMTTEGLDGLPGRVKEYRDMGARFAKWRAVVTIGPGIPTRYCIETNAHALARYAAICVEGGLVPIVEPEVLMDADNTIETCFDVTEWTLKSVFNALYEQRVPLEQILLKPNMVVSGKKCPVQAGVRQVAEMTLKCLRRCVPPAVPGVVFLSGGQSDEDATAHLNAMNQIGGNPWELSFSYGRALQAPSMKKWAGQAANVAAAQKIFHHRAKCNGAARSGKYSDAMERELAA
ncbi:MAG: fructose-bisphosphate aldolase [Candidatus Tectomicrobia bacterium RIFCSPLOWO2_12_FULL_69_37]|nr:MAG: fructose-bisphosphate aldolase [Candidatus Tectomicrobia bacterium RIFCSPLOWO2_02_FULL_70_19]OGL67335.1 MAG: fructose-bisphosphate aldolase [Candidatus Tectomicrobia bacterium RIFCSPLOWO2_12_FULL_69_37]